MVCRSLGCLTNGCDVMAIQKSIKTHALPGAFSNPKRILMIIPNLDFGGAQRAFSNLSIELAQKHQVYVTAFNTHGGVAFAHGGQLIDLEVPGGITVAHKIYFFLKRISRLRLIKRNYNIEI